LNAQPWFLKVKILEYELSKTRKMHRGLFGWYFYSQPHIHNLHLKKKGSAGAKSYGKEVTTSLKFLIMKKCCKKGVVLY